jgi:hypothetical protein
MLRIAAACFLLCRRACVGISQPIFGDSKPFSVHREGHRAVPYFYQNHLAVVKSTPVPAGCCRSMHSERIPPKGESGFDHRKDALRREFNSKTVEYICSGVAFTRPTARGRKCRAGEKSSDADRRSDAATVDAAAAE